MFLQICVFVGICTNKLFIFMSEEILFKLLIVSFNTLFHIFKALFFMFCTGEPLVRAFEHGQSNPTYYVKFGNRQLVLRKKPVRDLDHKDFHTHFSTSVTCCFFFIIIILMVCAYNYW